MLYKMEGTGRQLVAVNPSGTSQTCSAWGEMVRKNLTVHVPHCDCGLALDRDVNAARTGSLGHNLSVGLDAPRSSPL
ncbi:MAG: transposase [Anaerolineae bacterium]|nr:transposase [Anaerolineae bacterium]